MACPWKVDTLTQVFSPRSRHIAQSQIEESKEEIQMRKIHTLSKNYFNSNTNRNLRFPNKQAIQETALIFLAKTEVIISAEYVISTQKYFIPKKISPLGVTVAELRYSMKL